MKKSGKKDFKLKDYIVHGIYFLFYGLFKYFPSPIGDFFRKIISKIFFKRLGKVRIYEGATFWYCYNIEIGDNTTINEFVMLNGYGGLKIGNDVRIGHRTSILTSDHIIKDRDQLIHKQGLNTKSVIIDDNVFIGCNVTILAGVQIGTGAVIGAGSVVTKDVLPYTVVAGNPAKVIKER